MPGFKNQKLGKMGNKARQGSNTSVSDIGEILGTDNDSIIDIRRGNDSEA
tara:strand:- start:930 stop:1079 length:150 start_codon:yes stop_codon:yes gene_type:complete